MQFRPRRSVLYMPGANARAMEKARGLSCDAIIFDLEDAVAVDAKTVAREQVAQAVRGGGYGYRELIVRVNGLDTEWGHDDVAAAVGLPVDAVLFPKVETSEQVATIIDALDAAGGNALPVWLMIETPAGVLNAREVAGASPRVGCLVMGTSDLVKELRARHTPSRSNLNFALQHSVLAARSAGVDILDGVHLDFRNAEAFRDACEQGRDMGFDGKTLIHPTQIETANEVFGYGPAEVEHARAVIAAWETAQREGKGVAVLDGQLVENLHAAEAERVLGFAAAVSDR
jgi:citrate lyase subunit beta/citryl-CoA lyase